MINVTIENMKNNNDNIVPNQFIIHTPEGEYFQSYNVQFINMFQIRVILIQTYNYVEY